MAKCFNSFKIPWLLLYLALVCAAGLQQISNPRIVEHPEDQFVAKNEPATLNCKAEGEPPPIITWYRNGQPVITANENPSSHRMLLPSGQLFFLRVIHNKNVKPDVGVYYCNATNPETRISVVSLNATLEIAVIANEFREQPRSTDAAVGSDAVLECRPPRGQPEPRVRWKKDNEAVKLSDRFSILDSGALRINDVRKDDGGIYVCVGYNIGGERDSAPARLSIREKPRIVEGPKDVLVHENMDVYFQCRAVGDPEPTIIWKKVDEQMPQGRLHILVDRSLKIERARQSDEGSYVCRAENSVGWLEAEAKLTVHSQPSFIVTPRDKTVGIGRRVMFRCEVTGNPLPTVFWNKDSSSTLMFPNQDHGRISVSEDNTLVIESVQKDDAGEYICKGLSIAGSAYAKAKLEVKDIDSRPPPIIHHGPQNQTLPLTSPAFLRCSASGDPVPLIRWYKNGQILPVRDPRFTILDSGTLQIQDLRKADAGLYTCKAISETGETAWSAALTVETLSDTSVIFHRTPEPTAFPGPPSKPTVSAVTETSMRLTWKPNSNHGLSPVNAYTVEYFSHETGEGWVVASDVVAEPSYVVQGLRQDTSYMFLVRAQNSHGLSLPSHVTAPVRTKGSGLKPSLPPFDLGLVEEKLAGQIVTVFLPEALSSTAIKLSWEVRKNQQFIEGFHVRYRQVVNFDDRLGSLDPADWNIETIQCSMPMTYTLFNLAKYSWYEINVQPFYSTVVGQESNTVRARTFEDVPTAPPSDIQVKMVDNSTIYLTWGPPPKGHLNGALSGYKIFMYGSEAKYDREIPINSTLLEGIYIHHVVEDMTYKIQIAACNRMGEGVRSDPVLVGPQIAQKNIVKEAWFVATLIGITGGVLLLVLCILCVWLYRRRWSCKKLPKNMHPDVAGYKTHSCVGNGSIVNETLETTYLEKDSMQNITEVQYMNTTAGMKASYSKAHLAALHATASLLPTGKVSHEQRVFKPLEHSYMIHSGGHSSIDSGVKHDISSADSNNDADLPGNSGFYHQLEPCDFVCPMNNSGSYGHQYQVQPVLFLPPPPEHPPPSEVGTPPDLPSYNSYLQEMKLHHETNDPRRNFSESKRSRGYSADDMQRKNYAGGMVLCDRNNRICMHPPRNFESRLASQNSQVYSPHAMSGPEYRPSTGNQAHQLVPIEDSDGRRHFSDDEGAPAFHATMHGYSPLSPAPEDPAVNCEMPNLASDRSTHKSRLTKVKDKQRTAARVSNPPVSEIRTPDCHGLDGYMENTEPLPRISRPSQQSFSDNEEGFEAEFDPALLAWNEAHRGSNTNCSSLRSSAASCDDGSLQEKLDFISAVTKAAKMSGLTVANAPPLTSASANDHGKVKKVSKHRQNTQCTNPFRTDSNHSAVSVPHKSDPKSEHQLRNHYKTRPNDIRCDKDPTGGSCAPPALARAKSLKQELEVPPYSKPCFSNGSGIVSRLPATGQKLTSGTSGTASQSTAGTSGSTIDTPPRSNPVIAFDTRYMPIA